MSLNLEYQTRDTTGSSTSRRLRREADLVPAIIYGGDKRPQLIQILHKHLTKISEDESFFSQVIQLRHNDGKSERVVLKSLQRHAYKRRFLHADFLRVREDVKITMRVPLHFINEDTCIGVKQQGGIISHEMTELEVNCLPKDLPPFIEVDLAQVELNQVVHIGEIKLPRGLEATAMLQDKEGEHGHDLPVVRVIEQRVAPEEEVEEQPEEQEAVEGEEKEDSAQEEKPDK